LPEFPELRTEPWLTFALKMKRSWYQDEKIMTNVQGHRQVFMKVMYRETRALRGSRARLYWPLGGMMLRLSPSGRASL
jgi:hypothetical protein